MTFAPALASTWTGSLKTHDLSHPSPPPLVPFSLRTLFVLVAIVGVFSGWIGVQAKWIRERRAALMWLSHNGNYGANDGRKFTLVGIGQIHASPLGQPIKAPRSLRPFFEPGVSAITVVATPDENADQAKVLELSRLFPEADVMRMPNTAGGSAKPFHYEEDIQTGAVRRW